MALYEAKLASFEALDDDEARVRRVVHSDRPGWREDLGDAIRAGRGRGPAA